MNRAHSRSRLKNPGSFSPIVLFATGEQGAWYDPSDLLSMFQDDLGVTPVTAANQAVGMIRDKSGNGNHAVQATASSRPILRNSGALWWLSFDGVDDFLSTGSINFSASPKMTAIVGLNKQADTAIACVAELGVALPISSFLLTAPFGPSPTYGFSVRGLGAGFGGSITGFPALDLAVLTSQFDLTGGIGANQVILPPRRNGVTIPTGAGGTSGGGNFGNYPLFIGRRGDSTAPFTGNIYGLIIRGVLTDAAGVAGSESFMGSKTGVPL